MYIVLTYVSYSGKIKVIIIIIIIYTANELHSTQLENTHPGSEQLWLSIELRDRDRLLFGCIYRSPSSLRENDVQLYNSITNMCSTNHSHKLICGDFNTPGVDWRNWTSHGEPAHLLLDTLRDSYLFQHITEPTRLRGTDNPSLLDLVLTNEELMISETSYRSPLGDSDHVVLTFHYQCYVVCSRERVLRYLHHRGNYTKMRRDLSLNWDSLFEEYREDPDEQLKILMEVLHKTQEAHKRGLRSDANTDCGKGLWPTERKKNAEHIPDKETGSGR